MNTDAPLRPFESCHDRPKRRICMLMVTHGCNLNCTYCYERFKSNKMMSVEMAKSIIIKEFDEAKKSGIYNEIEFDLMGGEPFVNFALIKEIVEWVDAMNPAPLPYIFFASTNATLLTEERKEWLRAHRDSIALGASYDGSPEMQQTNRGNTSVDLAFFKETWPEQHFQMTISKESLPNMAAGIMAMMQQGYQIETSVAHGIDWTPADAQVYYQQLTILGKWFLEHPEVTPLWRLSRYLNLAADPQRVPSHKGCGTGTGMITYDVDGRTYGCHMFTPIVLGEARATELKNIDWEDERLFSDPVCDRCMLKALCSTCPGFNYHFRNHVGTRDKSRCGMALAEAKAAAEFQLALFCDHIAELSPSALKHAKAALRTHEALRHLSLGIHTSGPYTI